MPYNEIAHLVWHMQKSLLHPKLTISVTISAISRCQHNVVLLEDTIKKPAGTSAIIMHLMKLVNAARVFSAIIMHLMKLVNAAHVFAAGGSPLREARAQGSALSLCSVASG